VLAEILRRDPAGIVVAIGGQRSRWNELLLRRFRATMPDVVERIRLLPPQAYPDFLCLTAACDVMLDPLHFGGGNTTYEALSFGIPVVTLPSEFLRGRIAHALYQQMSLLDCVVRTPDEYVSLAVRLGTDGEFRTTIRQNIMAANSVLFESANGVCQLEDFLARAVEQPYSD
jgi:predicted O-linked N-acetylglucosamine transferase (SPINDLY family)